MVTRQIGYYDDGDLRAGTGRYLTEIISALDRRRYQPVFFAPRPRPWHEDLSRLDVECVYATPALTATTGEPGGEPSLPARPRRLRLPPPAAWTLGLLREIARLSRLFRSRRVDLLHSNNTGAEPAPIAARLAGIPRVTGTLHVLPSYDLDGLRNGARYRMLEKASMRALHHAIACCDAARREWDARCGLPASRVTVIHNGIRADRVARSRTRQAARESLGLPQDACILATIGNLHRYKGHEHLIRALPTLAAAQPRVLVAIAGSGPAEAELRLLADTLQVRGHLRLLGFCGEIGALLDAADIYVQPSLVEAFPISILEASANGLPVVATAVGGVPEAIEDHISGLLVPPADPGALARAISSLADCPERMREFGQAGRSRVLTHFTTEQMLAKTTALYDRLLA